MKLIFTQHVDKLADAVASKIITQGWCIANKIAMETRTRDLGGCINELVLEDEDGFVLQWATNVETLHELEANSTSRKILVWVSTIFSFGI